MMTTRKNTEKAYANRQADELFILAKHAQLPVICTGSIMPANSTLHVAVKHYAFRCARAKHLPSFLNKAIHAAVGKLFFLSL